MALFPDPILSEVPAEFLKKWERLLEIRGEITKALERARKDQRLIGNTLEAQVLIRSEDQALADFLKSEEKTLEYLAIVSDLTYVDFFPEVRGEETTFISDEIPGLFILVRKAFGKKCERCWQWKESVGTHPDIPQVCERCYHVLNATKEEILEDGSS